MHYYYDPIHLYNAHRGEVKRLLGDEMPFWDELTYLEQCYWQREADDLNEARETLVHGNNESR